MNWLLVVLGGAVGAPLRYLTDRAVQARHGAGLPYVFPWGTFTVNAAGSLLLGVLTGATVSAPVHALLGTGLCGALTTYSTFSYETLRLAEEGAASSPGRTCWHPCWWGSGRSSSGRNWPEASEPSGRAVREGGPGYRGVSGRVPGGGTGVGHITPAFPPFLSSPEVHPCASCPPASAGQPSPR